MLKKSNKFRLWGYDEVVDEIMKDDNELEERKKKEKGDKDGNKE